MKKTLLSALMVSATSLLIAQTRVTNNPVLVINPGSPTCNAGGIITTDNSFFHIYDLDDYPNIVDTAFIVRMKVACEETTGGPYNIVGAVYTVVGSPSLANFSLVSDDTTAIFPDSTMYKIAIPFDQGYVFPGDSLASELKLPTNATASFYPGSNTSPESSPTYIVAAGCSIFDLTTMAGISFPDMHLIMNLYLNQKPAMDDFSTSIFKNDSVYFTDADFSSNFNDNDNDGITMMKVTTLPSNGILDLNGTTLAIGDTVLTSEMNTLYYIPNTGYSGSDNFSFRARDTSHWANTPTSVTVDVINWQLGIDDQTTETFTVYPNPATQVVNLPSDIQFDLIRIFDTNGKQVMIINQVQTSLDISKLENGVYYLVTTVDGINKTAIFTKQ